MQAYVFLDVLNWIFIPGPISRDRVLAAVSIREYAPIEVKPKSSMRNITADMSGNHLGKNTYSTFRNAAVHQLADLRLAAAARVSLKQQLEDDSGYHKSLDKLIDTRRARAVLKLRREWREIQDQDQFAVPQGQPIRQLDAGKSPYLLLADSPHTAQLA